MAIEPNGPLPRGTWVAVAIAILMMLAFAWGYANLGPYFNR